MKGKFQRDGFRFRLREWRKSFELQRDGFHSNSLSVLVRCESSVMRGWLEARVRPQSSKSRVEVQVVLLEVSW